MVKCRDLNWLAQVCNKNSSRRLSSFDSRARLPSKTRQAIINFRIDFAREVRPHLSLSLAHACVPITELLIFSHFNIRLTRRKIFFWDPLEKPRNSIFGPVLNVSIFTISCYEDLSFSYVARSLACLLTPTSQHKHTRTCLEKDFL